MKNAPKTQGGELTVKEETVDLVEKKIAAFTREGKLLIPENYSPENAMKSAWLQLIDTLDKNKKPVLQVCTKATIANALFSMVISGLNPVKKQCYFIAYGTTLTMMPSYQGNKAMALRVDPDLKKIVALTVYAADDFSYEYVMGELVIGPHRQILANIDKTKIVAAYAMAITHENTQKYADLMQWEDIKQSWKQSRNYPFDNKGNLKPDSVHAKFTAAMCERTVINRLCKNIIGSSDDKNLIKQAMEIIDDEQAKAIAQEEADEKANQGDIIDVKSEPDKAKPAKKAKPQTTEKKPVQDPVEEKADPEPETKEMSEAEKEEIRLEEMAAAEKEMNHQGAGKPPF